MGMKEKAAEGVREIKEEAKVVQGEKSKDKVYKTSREFESEEAARTEFLQSKQRLFDVNAWTNIPALVNSAFILFTADGRPLKEKARVEEGDFIKIDLPGPLPFYWVKVNEVSEGEQEAQFTVQPTYDPTDNDDKTV